MTSRTEDHGESTRSKTSSKPRASTNVRSKHSTAQVIDVQETEPKEVDSRGASKVDKPTWLFFMVMLLGYGMYLHNDTILLGVMVVVTDGCGYGKAVETLLRFLEARGILPQKPL